MKLIVGLGNPGKEYENTRHNSGFLAMDRLLKKCNNPTMSKKFDAYVGKVNIDGENVLLMKPLTYMNLSGSAVNQAVKYYQIEPEDILVIHDDMDLPVGSLRIREKGSSGGQKGMQSIIDALGTREIARIRIGVGHSKQGAHDEVPDWVLSAVPKSEKEKFEIALENASEAAYAWVTTKMDLVKSRYNIREKKIVEEQGKDE